MIHKIEHSNEHWNTQTNTLTGEQEKTRNGRREPSERLR